LIFKEVTGVTNRAVFSGNKKIKPEWSRRAECEGVTKDRVGELKRKSGV
jgi:hypothetical protein